MANEFEFIETIKSKFSLDRIGDDCAVLPKDGQTDLLLTADMLVEDIDFRLEWTTPEFLGHKALAVSLSDIAAMGGESKWAMLSIAVPENVWKTDFIDRFYDGWHMLARKYKIELVGGDISRSPDKLVIDSIVGGKVLKGKAILRSGAMPGDSIYVTGSLGGAAGGLMLLESGYRYSTSTKNRKKLITRHLRPTPQLLIGKQLSQLCLATAMIDMSDGLSSDLTHLCWASGVGAQIHVENIPVDPNLSKPPMNTGANITFALNGGEDFELLFTSSEKKISRRKVSGIHRIGEITADIGLIEIVNDGQTSILPPKGYKHFG